MIDYHFTSLNRSISASKSVNKPLEALFLHGAGKATRQRSKWIAEFLDINNIGPLSFDFIGHGETGGTMQGTTIAMRKTQAESAILQLDKHTAIFGFSMGGHVAIDLACEQKFDNLILFCPAIYPDNAQDIPFGNNFSEAIRKPNAWRDSSLFQKLHDYEGRILIIIGSGDTVIPDDLPESIQSAAMSAKSVNIHRVRGADHYLLKFLVDNTQDKNEVLRLVHETIRAQ